MTIFILEDNLQRMMWFNKRFMNHTVIHFEEAIKAIDWLKKNDAPDYIFLDHDLGGRTFVSSEEKNTGYTVAKYLNSIGNDGMNVILHGLNPAGVKNMMKELPKAVPFSFIRMITEDFKLLGE